MLKSFISNKTLDAIGDVVNDVIKVGAELSKKVDKKEVKRTRNV